MLQAQVQERIHCGILDTIALRLEGPVIDDDLRQLPASEWTCSERSKRDRWLNGSATEQAFTIWCRPADGVRVMASSRGIRVEATLPRVAGLGHRNEDLSEGAALLIIRSITQDLFPASTEAARKAGLGWIVVRIDLARNFRARSFRAVALAHTGVKYSRVRQPGRLTEDGNVLWLGPGGYSATLYDKGKSATTPDLYYASDDFDDRDPDDVPDLDPVEVVPELVEEGRNVLGRIEECYRHPRNLRRVADALEPGTDLFIRIRRPTSPSVIVGVKLSNSRLHGLLASNLARVVPKHAALPTIRRLGDVGAIALALDPELASQVFASSAASSKSKGAWLKQITAIRLHDRQMSLAHLCYEEPLLAGVQSALDVNLAVWRFNETRRGRGKPP